MRTITALALVFLPIAAIAQQPGFGDPAMRAAVAQAQANAAAALQGLQQAKRLAGQSAVEAAASQGRVIALGRPQQGPTAWPQQTPTPAQTAPPTGVPQ